MIYLSLYFSCLLASFLSLSKGFPVKQIFELLTFSIILIIGFRYASVDYFQYWQIYNNVDSFNELGFFITTQAGENTPVETGFAILILLEKFFFGNFYSFIFLFAFLSVIIKFTAFKKMSPYLLISILLYLSDEYFWKEMGQIRNAMASGIVLWAFYYAYTRKFLVFVFLVFIAGLFHSAAFVALPFYFVAYFNNRCLMLSVLLMSLLVTAWKGGVATLTLDLAGQLGFESTSRLVKYADSKYVQGIAFFGGTFFLRLFTSLFMIIFYKNLSAKCEYNHLLIPAYVYSVIILFLFNNYAIIGSRVYEMIALPISCVIIPSFLLLLNNQSRHIGFLFIILYSSTYFFAIFNRSEPYKSILFIN